MKLLYKIKMLNRCLTNQCGVNWYGLAIITYQTKTHAPGTIVTLSQHNCHAIRNPVWECPLYTPERK